MDRTCPNCGKLRRKTCNLNLQLFYLRCHYCNGPRERISKDTYYSFENMANLKKYRFIDIICPKCKVQKLALRNADRHTPYDYCYKCKLVIKRSESSGLGEDCQSVAIHNTPPRSKSGYKGVHWVRTSGKYQVRVNKNGVKHYGGTFEDPDKAAIEANALMRSLYGEHAYQNEIVTKRNPEDYEYGTKGYISPDIRTLND